VHGATTTTDGLTDNSSSAAAQAKQSTWQNNSCIEFHLAQTCVRYAEDERRSDDYADYDGYYDYYDVSDGYERTSELQYDDDDQYYTSFDGDYGLVNGYADAPYADIPQSYYEYADKSYDPSYDVSYRPRYDDGTERITDVDDYRGPPLPSPAAAAAAVLPVRDAYKRSVTLFILVGYYKVLKILNEDEIWHIAVDSTVRIFIIIRYLL